MEGKWTAFDGGMNFAIWDIVRPAGFRPLSNYSWVKDVDIPSEMSELFLDGFTNQRASFR
jgi:hypothetical protein